MRCVIFVPCFSFPIDSAMSKRCAEITTGASTKKRLSAKQFVARASAPSTGTSGANLSELEPVKVNVVKWVNDARYVFEDLHHEVAMYQYQVVHEKRPSILFQFLTEFKKFIQTIDPSFTSLDEFEKQRSVRVVMPGDRFEDVDHVGIVPWRLAFYAATMDTKSILNIIYDFVNWKCQQLEFSSFTPPKIMLTYASKTYVNVDNEINFNIMPMGSFAMHAFDAAPARGKRHLIMSVEKGDSDDVCDVLFLGSTWPFRQEFEAAQIQGGYIEPDSGSKEYCRMLKKVSIDKEGCKLLVTILTKPLKNTTIFLNDFTDEVDNSVVKFLRGLPMIFTR